MTTLRSAAQRVIRLGILRAAPTCLLLLTGGAFNLAHAAEPNEGPVKIRGAEQSEPVTPGLFERDLRDLPLMRAWQPGDPIREVPRVTRQPQRVPAQPKPLSRDPLLEFQTSAPRGVEPRVFSTPDRNFEGIPFTGAYPPDTVGDVGPNHYIQMVNDGTASSMLAIYNKAGTLVVGPIRLQTLWTAGGACASGQGDPIVLYDPLANRWLLSEFASSGNHLCVYISRTPDPVSGGWYNYDFATPSFPDYPKYGVWPDAYYVSTNENPPAVYALDRTRMLQGLSATSQRFTVPSLAGFGFQSLTPGDIDGSTPPPAGAPGYFMRHRDDEVHNVGSNNAMKDFLEVWEFHVDFANVANSTLTGPTNIQVAEFDSRLCGLVSFNCFPQPGTAQTLDPLREVIMWRLQYRNRGTHDSLVGNFVTDVSGADQGGIRWFELRKTGGGAWTLLQEGTHAPDTNNRWMGSIAMDKDGNMALGYSVSSSSVFPSIRYAGRLATDPNGQLQSEVTLVAGGASQTAFDRWGDYSSMTVDPADDCTFWYTNEYIPAGTNGQWRTRIGSFKFPSCTPSAMINATTPVTITAENAFPLNNAPDPGETLTETLPLVNVGAANTTNLVATLQATGGVTNPSGPQNYGVVVAGGAAVARPFTFTAAGSCGANITLTLALQDGATSLGTINYTQRLGTTVIAAYFGETFDGVAAPALPAGWTTAATGGALAWVTSTTNPNSAPNDAFAPDVSTVGNTELVTPTINVPAMGGQLTFKNLYNMEAGFDGMVLEISINGGAFSDITTGGNAFITGGYTHTISSTYSSPISGRMAWSGLSGGTTAAPSYITSTINLPAAAAGQPIKLKWRAATDSSVIAAGAAGVRIDNITLTTTSNVCSNVATPPSAPTVVSTTAGNGSITVNFTAPLSNGGAPITGYTATCTSSNGGVSNFNTGGPSATSIQVTGLTNGKNYTCTVTATNSAGLTGSASAPSNTVIPKLVDITPILMLLLD